MALKNFLNQARGDCFSPYVTFGNLRSFWEKTDIILEEDPYRSLHLALPEEKRYSHHIDQETSQGWLLMQLICDSFFIINGNY